MVIALHNIGVENEFLKQYQQSLSFYTKAKMFAESALGAEHGMTKKMESVLVEAETKIRETAQRSMVRKSTTNPMKQGGKN